jgi:hypothetical protein
MEAYELRVVVGESSMAESKAWEATTCKNGRQEFLVSLKLSI